MTLSKKDHVCDDLPWNPRPDLGTVLVTGASGYIGGRLVPELLARGYKVRVMVRSGANSYAKLWPEADIVIADAFNIEELIHSMEGVDIAYYLIHSLTLGNKKFEEADEVLAFNFRLAAEKQELKRIIYLSGLGRDDVKLSPHLESRMKVGESLCQGKVPVTILRAGMIIGSGSASYIILESLVKNSTFFFIPYWAKTKGQPIAINDVIKYLVGVMEVEETRGKTYDIGGDTIISYDRMLKVFARLRGKKRYFFPSIFTSTSIYGYLSSLLTPVPRSVTMVLIEGCKNEVICQNNEIKTFLPFTTMTFREALCQAMKTKQSGRKL